jgi:hypothetical protein
MRNPFGSNLDGSWLLASNEGDILYGDTQEQLIEVALSTAKCNSGYKMNKN